MALEPGSRLGAYEVGDSVGAGAMGEVYRALDVNLGREIALKVLPEEFTSDPERLARFDREAKLLASLNHPNIATVHGIVEDGGRRALVMELVPGEELAARLDRGALPLEDAVPIARQIAEALEAAHEHGVIHRDLKPANIKITPSGQVKVLDFGLAKAVERAAASATSPTITSLGTVAGVILGTAAYMSPEQARGKDADRRADVWAFGVILYEMLSGRRLFDGETVSDTLAAVLTKTADLTSLPSSTPQAIRKLLARCLDRDPRTRLRDIGEARVALTSPFEEEPAAAAPRRGPTALQILAIAVAVSVVASLAGAFATKLLSRNTPLMTPALAFDVTAGPAMRIGSLALSPDGRNLVFSSRRTDGDPELVLRPMGSFETRTLPGTRGAEYPFWSPDGREIAFFAGGQLVRLALDETTPHRIAAAQGAVGGSWGRQGSIVYGTANGPVFKVSAAGGTPAVPVTKKTPTEIAHAWPVFLADGRRFVYLVDATTFDEHAIKLSSIDDEPAKTLITRIRSAPLLDPRGRLLLVRDHQLVAYAFDDAKGELRGEPRVVVEGVYPTGTLHHTPVSLSDTGMLAYQTAALRGTLARYDLEGRVLATLGGAGEIDEPSISPDGKLIAFANFEGAEERRIQVLDVARGVKFPISHAGASADDAVWSADGDTVYFDANPGGRWTVFRTRISGGRPPENLGHPAGGDLAVLDLSKDGRTLLVSGTDPSGNYDLYLRDVGLPADAPWTPWRPSPATEDGGTFSPDGRYVAFVSNASEKAEVYVTPLAGGPDAPRWQVSAAGGEEPRWSPDGRRLYFRSPSQDLMSATITVTGSRVEVGAPVRLFALPIGTGAYHLMSYSIAPDGKSLVTIQRTSEAAPAIHVRTGW